MAQEQHLANLTIIGVGRVGLPLALAFAQEGFKVYGLDIDEKKIETLKNKKMPFMEKDGQKLLEKHVGKNFLPSIETSIIAECDYVILTLGTPVGENMTPVLDQIDTALEKAKPFLRENQTLILRSTVSPGTTGYVKSFINAIPELQVGDNFFLAFCPERIAEGQALKELYEIPQIIGGTDAKSSQKAAWLFRHFGVNCLITDETSAELAKLFTNMYRYISFAIPNEFMIIAENHQRDIYHIVDLVNRGYKRGGLALPGVTAGPCLYKDGFFLINELPFIDLITSAWKINEAIPLFLMKQVKEKIELVNKKVAILGLAFKANIDDTRQSLSLKVESACLRERAQVSCHDPFVTGHDGDVYEILGGASAVFIMTNHDPYRQIDIEKIKSVVAKDCVFCDIWNILKTNKIVFSLDELNNNARRS